MTLELWTGSGSPYAWRVQLALAFKGLTYTNHVIEFSKREHRSPAFLARNPRGKVPVLKVGELVLYESTAILAWLEARYPSPPLLGRTPDETGRIWQRLAEVDNYLSPAGHSFYRPVFFGDASAVRRDIERAAGGLHLELAGLESLVSAHPYLAGDGLSAADLAAYPLLQTALRAANKPVVADFELELLPFAEHYPALAAWMARIEALPGYDATYPPHWR